jgi:hypothetical protein
MQVFVLIVFCALGFVTAAGAATLTVVTTNGADVVQDLFIPGETVVLRVDGDSEGAEGNSMTGLLRWDTAGGTAFAATQTQMFQFVYPPWYGTGFGGVMNQVEFSGNFVQPITPVFLGTVSLIAGSPGIYPVTWDGSLSFFGFCAECGEFPSGHTFTIVPEPATVVLTVLSLLGLGGWRRRRHSREPLPSRPFHPRVGSA